ncbi:MAG: hypothetical protein ACRDPY_28610 [Streptosporangiaceae bacterium]
MGRRLTAEEIIQRAQRGAAVREKLNDPTRPQLSLEDVVAASDAADVVQAMNQGQLVDLGYGAPRGHRAGR